MTKAMFRRSTRVARPNRTGLRFLAEIPVDARPLPGGMTRSLMATPIRTGARQKARQPFGAAALRQSQRACDSLLYTIAFPQDMEIARVIYSTVSRKRAMPFR